jgi:hypothetical protein
MVLSDNAFHEKAGRSQGDSFWYLLVTLFLSSRAATVATLPSALFDERFYSLGASCTNDSTALAQLYAAISEYVGPGQ